MNDEGSGESDSPERGGSWNPMGGMTIWMLDMENVIEKIRSPRILYLKG